MSIALALVLFTILSITKIYIAVIHNEHLHEKNEPIETDKSLKKELIEKIKKAIDNKHIQKNNILKEITAALESTDDPKIKNKKITDAIENIESLEEKIKLDINDTEFIKEKRKVCQEKITKIGEMIKSLQDEKDFDDLKGLFEQLSTINFDLKKTQTTLKDGQNFLKASQDFDINATKIMQSIEIIKDRKEKKQQTLHQKIKYIKQWVKDEVPRAKSSKLLEISRKIENSLQHTPLETASTISLIEKFEQELKNLPLIHNSIFSKNRLHTAISTIKSSIDDEINIQEIIASSINDADRAQTTAIPYRIFGLWSTFDEITETSRSIFPTQDPTGPTP